MLKRLDLKLPQKPLALWILAIALWIAQPITQLKYLVITQSLGYYPPEADSIGIPALGLVVLAVFGFPVWILLCWKASRPYVPATVFEWSRASLAHSIGVSLGFSLLIALNIAGAYGDVILYRDMSNPKWEEVRIFAIY